MLIINIFLLLTTYEMMIITHFLLRQQELSKMKSIERKVQMSKMRCKYMKLKNIGFCYVFKIRYSILFIYYVSVENPKINDIFVNRFSRNLIKVKF